VVILVPLMLVVILVAVRLVGESRGPEPVTSRSEHPLPTPPEQPPPLEAVPGPGEPYDDGASPPELAPAAAPGLVVLDIGMTELRVEPAPAGSPLQLLADYDQSAFELVEQFIDGDDGGWTYRVSFSGRGGWLGAVMRGVGAANDLRLSLPVDRPMRLEGSIGPGESRLDLGGLWLTDVDLSIRAGSHRVVFSEPLRRPLGSLAVRSSYGESRVMKVGNASPERAWFEHDAGELVVDLDGDWRADAAIDVDFSFGECRVLLPSTAAVELGRVSLSFGEKTLRGLPRREDLPPDAPTLVLSVSGTGGGLSIR
jgi:hypothetical protein